MVKNLSKQHDGTLASNSKRQLLAQLLKRKDALSHVTNKILPRPAEAIVPLSFAQERLWFLQQWEPDNPAYNIIRACRVTGALDEAALARSIEIIAERHEVVRSKFPNVGDHPAQQLLPAAALTLRRVDLRRRPRRRARAAESARQMAEEASNPFDLAAGPLLRITLFRFSTDDHVLMLAAHQSVFDGRSLDIFYRELEALYLAGGAVEGLKLPLLSVQYADYALWQRNQQRRDEFIEQLDYWKARLAGSLRVLELPADRPRTAPLGFKGARRKIVINETITSALKELSRKSATTLFVTLMAAYKVLLYRYTGEKNIIVGFAVSNRDRPELENLIGNFVNTLPLRSDLSGAPSFRALLAQVRVSVQEALSHCGLPFERLVEELPQQRDFSRNPLFQTMFTFQNRLPAELRLAGVQVEPIDCDTGSAKFDLTLALGERDGRLLGSFEYRSDLFDAATIDRMIGHFLTLLKGIIADPETSIATLPLLTSAERRRVLIEWNNTASAYPKQRCVHQLFEAQAKKTPKAVALKCAGQSLTYRELDRRANQLARHLQMLRAGPEKRIGICLGRSMDLVIGLLAVFKAGAAYVPLDPEYPRERIEFMLKDAGVELLLTQRRIAKTLGFPLARARESSLSVKVICVDDDCEMIARQKSRGCSSNVTGQSLAYVIYTSGSTGQPKGVAIEHINAVAFLCWAKRAFSTEELSCVLASTSVCFDLSVFELFAPLCWGGKVMLVENALALAEMNEKNTVTLVNTVPSAIAELLALGPLPRSVETVNLAGEPLKAELVNRVYEGSAVKRVYDLYGPSETTTYSTFILRGRESRATIGRPIANTKIYLLDDALEPVPVGVPGELYIGGAGVARGYLNRPELTRERFIVNPFGSARDDRLYRTGDLARYLPDGNIEYLGRLDNQVKIRGHRIELGEIETVLGHHPLIKECAVVADFKSQILDGESQSQITDRQLVAYVVANGANLPDASELRSFLQKTLPAFMVPAAFVGMGALPLMPNGKLDRKALPAPDGGRPGGLADFVLPRGEVEELIAQIWREVLQIEEISVSDNFFDLGGHSLLATRVAARLRSNFKIDFALRKLFELPTIAELAGYVSELRRAHKGPASAPILPIARTGALPLSSAQKRLWYLHSLDPASNAYNIPAAYRIHGPLHVTALAAALNLMVQRHESLRTTICELNGQPVQRILAAVDLPLPIVDLAHCAADRLESDVSRLVTEEARLPYDLAEGPLLRARLLRLGAAEHVLALNFHHIIADATSLANFFRELAIFYENLSAGKPAALTPLALQFTDYAAWQQDWLGGETAAAQLAYWQRQLANVAPLDLPADFDRPARQSYRGARIMRRLPVDLTRALKQMSRRCGVTLFMTLLAGLNILLARLSGRDDIVVGSTVAGRNRPELEGVIGFFINALALRSDLSGSPCFSELLKRVREVCLEAYTHQDLPFDTIVEALNPERDQSRHPLFQVMFNSNEVGARTLKLADCVCEKITQEEPAAKFDMVLYAPEIDGAVELTMVYNADLFTEARVDQCLEQLSLILTQAVAAPDRAIDQYSLVTTSSRSILPDPVAPLGDGWRGAVQDLVSRQARRAGERLALAEAGSDWTYRQLDEQSSRLANLLLRSGIQRGEVVAIYAERRAVLAVALLGVLKAGAVFVILDPAYPALRLCDYLRIAQPKGWLHLESASEFPAELGQCLDDADVHCRIQLPAAQRALAAFLTEYATTNPAIAFSVDDPAYIAFTSGSTGEPKGVLGRHGPMSHFLPWQEKIFALSESDRYCLFAGLGYNHLQREVFTALASGAALFVPAAAQMRSPAQLVEWLRENEITVLHLTPALGRMLHSAGAAPLPELRRIFFGGDLLTRQDAAAMRALAPNAKIVCFYGATETQRAVGFFAVEEENDFNGADRNTVLPTGRGAQDVQLLLLTTSGQLAGVGELGEIYVRSPHLAAGYVGDAELTARNFLVNPFTRLPRDRLYRTGERGRYRPDGDVEWVGRADRRAGIRGFRVELAEVEAALLQYPAVRQAAVVGENLKLKSGPADKNSKLSERLIAYVVTVDSQQNFVPELRGFLAARLPHYMIPAEFVLLERLPLSPNGKVDYASLPAASGERAVDVAFEAPSSELERRLAEIFTDVLGVARIGRWDDFFQLGGHSLLAAQVSARIRQKLNIGLELREFLDAPTIAALARHLESRPLTLPRRALPSTGDREEIEL